MSLLNSILSISHAAGPIWLIDRLVRASGHRNVSGVDDDIRLRKILETAVTAVGV